MRQVLFFCLFLISMLSCQKKDENIPALSGLKYFPTDSGRYWIYEVHSIKYNNDTIDTTFQLKQLMYDTYYFQNILTYKLYRFSRPDASSAWPVIPDSVWTCTTDLNQITINEGGSDYIRLVFPLSAGKKWNGNARNIASPNTYTVKSFNSPLSISNFFFPETCNIEEAQSINLVNKDFRNRIYAKNIGMIYKKYEQLTYNTEPSNIGLYKIEFGSVYEETLLEYGTP